MNTKTICIKPVITFIGILLISFQLYSQEILIETESFTDKGGWVVDPQFVEQMGSPYLMAHGIGKPVENAKTTFSIHKKGNYHIWVRTMNWAPGNWETPGKFQLKIENNTFSKVLGTSKKWDWEYVGEYEFSNKKTSIELIDLTGFNGRCDAIYFSKNKITPPSKSIELKKWREKLTKSNKPPKKTENFDLVIVGGGIAGCAAAISAAEQGLNVALIHDRPVLGGNASGEIRVHTEGIYGYFERILKMIDTDHYPNGSSEAYDDDDKRMKNIKSYKNIHLFLNWRAYDASSKNNLIKFVDAKHTSTSERIRFKAPLFVDSTGDGWVGFWSNANFMYGRESKSTFNEGWEKHGELWSPKIADNFVMGSSVLWGSKEMEFTSKFPQVPWALEVAKQHAAANGEWKWEFSRNDLNQIDDAEQIRDHMLKAIFGSFYNEKQKEGNEKLALEWVSYLVGKRESRRLVGDYIYTFNDVKNQTKFEDAVVLEKRSVDVHYQQKLNNPEKPNFLSEALFYRTTGYQLPYRSLYSKNINNLFMAGRDFSCSHIGLGGPRVMNTTGQMGAAVGYAASICKKYNTNPRVVYENHLNELMKLVKSSSKQKQNN
ncbi:FAD-dependent oxidoreductase [uncultured Lutibacter sp.]|uniref:FAD-dependent oxidoreductase n=1 Tax=uncultured Lutibacter sp. TaxID=437739 RepID=UPI00260CAA62|nr:FAD-dependent oxidoreductase [uncultured Lutibacter sp.]